MSEVKTTATKLKGVKRRIVLLDDVPRDLSFDFNAQCVIEEETRKCGVSPEEERTRVLAEVNAVAEAKAKGVEHVPQAHGPGFYRTMGIFAYALTSSWREDSGEKMSYHEFSKILPNRPAERLRGWIEAVTAVMTSEIDAEEAGDSGNAPSPETGPKDASK